MSMTKHGIRCKKQSNASKLLKKQMLLQERFVSIRLVTSSTKFTMYQPKYIQGLITSAATRKLDHLRAEEKMMQREREAEGDLYNDKESFVTQAYKDQMEQVRKAE